MATGKVRSMSYYIDQFTSFTSQIVDGVWRWFTLLSTEEWVVVLTLVAVVGFLCMLGYGSRSKY